MVIVKTQHFVLASEQGVVGGSCVHNSSKFNLAVIRFVMFVVSFV